MRAKTSPHRHRYVASSAVGSTPVHTSRRVSLIRSRGRALHLGQVIRGRRRVARGQAERRATLSAFRAGVGALSPLIRLTTAASKTGPPTRGGARSCPGPQ